MKKILCAAAAAALATGVALWAQAQAHGTTVNLATAKWTHDAGDPPGSESVMLRDDSKTGAIELLVRYPAGHVIAPHSHDSNEHVIVVEGQLTINGSAVDAGGYAYLPAHDPQRISCTSKTRCGFYLIWDGSPASHPVR